MGTIREKNVPNSFWRTPLLWLLDQANDLILVFIEWQLPLAIKLLNTTLMLQLLTIQGQVLDFEMDSLE